MKWYQELDNVTLIDALVGAVQSDLDNKLDERSDETKGIVAEILNRMKVKP